MRLTPVMIYKCKYMCHEWTNGADEGSKSATDKCTCSAKLIKSFLHTSRTVCDKIIEKYIYII